jgi:hypothetical protein
VLLLPIAAMAVLAFFAVLLMTCVAGTWEQRERRRRALEGIFAGMSPRSLTDNTRLVWWTQVPALQYLESRDRQGAPANALRPLYAAMMRRYPALYEGHSFEEWLQFLSQAGVVFRQQERLLLAPHGHNLLDQCRDSCGHDFH